MNSGKLQEKAQHDLASRPPSLPHLFRGRDSSRVAHQVTLPLSRNRSEPKKIAEYRADRAYLDTDEAELLEAWDDLSAELESTKKLATEWESWLNEALDALGAKTVFEIKEKARD